MKRMTINLFNFLDNLRKNITEAKPEAPELVAKKISEYIISNYNEVDQVHISNNIDAEIKVKLAEEHKKAEARLSLLSNAVEIYDNRTLSKVLS
jgi:hypothetical protein